MNDSNISFATSDDGIESISIAYDVIYLTTANNFIAKLVYKFRSFELNENLLFYNDKI